jgi:HD-GYP domain-containing protein (c-di-GMP phosphodiesterase class II)
MDENQKLEEIIRLGAELNNIQDLDILLERILLEARKCVYADAGTIYLREGDFLVFSNAQNEAKQAALPLGEKLIYTSFKIPINKESISGYVGETGEIVNIEDAYEIPEDADYHFDRHFDKKTNYRTQSMLTVPLISETKAVIGALQIINRKATDGKIVGFNAEDELFVYHFASTASMVLQRNFMTRTLLLRMIDMARLRDPKETGPHVNRVAAYAVEIYERWALAKGVPLDKINENRDVLRMAAMLHDVGKVGISDSILKKPSRFTADEFNIMKTHTNIGGLLFQERHSRFDEIAAIVAFTHHENWNGIGGYPGHVDIHTGEVLKTDAHGKPLPKKGEEIPIFGRICAIADVYDALSCKRVYKEAWSEQDVLNEIEKERGKKFDPDVVDAFFKSLHIIKSITTKYPDED